MERSFFFGRKAPALLLAAVLCLCTVKQLHAYTAYEKTRILVAEARQVCTITAWHYSGGYWMAENGRTRVKIPDSAVKGAGFARALSESISACWTIRIPEAVLSARRDGAVITAEVPDHGQYYSSIRSRSNSPDELRIEAAPIIFTSGRTLKDYVPGIRADIPVISLEHGRNLYALYGRGLGGSTAPGAFSQSQPSRIFEPYIHPSMIKNALGTLIEDGSVYAGGSTLPSKGISVGLLTLFMGGAVGVQFDIPITVYFYAETLVPVTHDVVTDVPQDRDHAQTAPVIPEAPRFRPEDYLIHRVY